MSYHPTTGFPLASDDYRIIRAVCIAVEDELYATNGARERKDHARAVWHLRGVRMRLLACRFRRDVLDLYNARKALTNG